MKMPLTHKLFLLGFGLAYAYFPIYGFAHSKTTIVLASTEKPKHEIVQVNSEVAVKNDFIESETVNKPSTDIEKVVYETTVLFFGEKEWEPMYNLVKHESGFKPHAVNKRSGACGLGQALPCSKMNCSLQDASCQAKWMAKYIKGRYGNPTNAWNHWKSRVKINGQDVGNWY